MVIVTPKNITECVDKILEYKEVGTDTETTGLLEKHRMFSLQIATDDEVYYFNFKDYGLIAVPVLKVEESLPELKRLFTSPKLTHFISNAKFDMRMLLNHGIEISGTTWCVSAMGRVLKNNLPSIKSYSLNELSKLYLDQEKIDEVKTFVEQYKLWDSEKWFNEIKLHYRYQDVPYDIMLKYAAQDARLHLKLGQFQKKMLKEWEKNKNLPPIRPLVLNELQLTKTLFKMERTGIRANVETINSALLSENLEIESLKQEFLKLTGFDFYDGPSRLVEVFRAQGIPVPRTALGNPSFSKDALEYVDHPVVGIIQKIRWLTNRVGTYYPNYLYYTGQDGIIHPDIRQNGAETGRMSCVNPNLNNIPSRNEESAKYPIRQHFIPRDGNSFICLDYKQQELRIMLDQAGETKLIKAIMEGADPHQGTADLVGLTRDQAKTINFGLIYGTGVDLLAKQLGVNKADATEMKKQYFSKMKKVKTWIENTRTQAENEKVCYNWFGRRCFLSDKKYSYIIPNHRIQGGGADVVKIAMNRCSELERKRKIQSPGLILPIHDELVFELHPNDFSIIPNYIDIMENSYVSKNGMKLEVDIHHSFTSLSKKDLIKGAPVCKKTLTTTPLHQKSDSPQTLTGSTL